MIIVKNTSPSNLVLPDIGKSMRPGLALKLFSTADIDKWRYSADVEQAILDGKLAVGDENQICTDPTLCLLLLRQLFDGTAYVVTPKGGLRRYDPALQTDGPTGVKTTNGFYNLLSILRELFNDQSNPLFVPGFTPILGPYGWQQDYANRINNLEVIHGPEGYHTQDIKAGQYFRPMDVLFYYAYLNSFNYTANSWDNELVAQDMAQYSICVFGSGVQDPTHPDYANTQVIIPRLRALNPAALHFGYVTLNQDLPDLYAKVDQWDALSVNGIFLDEAGYDFGNTRSKQNQAIQYIHNAGLTVFINAFNFDHILGIDNDPSFPNETYNEGLDQSLLDVNDWALLESFGVNTQAYTTTGGYEEKATWAARGVKAMQKRFEYGINLAGVSIIGNSDPNAQSLFDFGFRSALMWALDAYGSSDDFYAAGTALVTKWVRNFDRNIGRIWSNSPSVQLDLKDSDVYWRYAEFGKVKLDFSSGAEASDIILY